MDIVNTKLTEPLSSYGVQSQVSQGSVKDEGIENVYAKRDTEASKQSDKDKSSGTQLDLAKSKVENSAQVSAQNSDTRDTQVTDLETLRAATEQIESFMQSQQRNLAFSVDEGTSRSVVTVKDASSGDVIRQIPSEEVLKLAERIQELQQDIGNKVGVLVNQQI
jgi:flagellar protein FlaG